MAWYSRFFKRRSKGNTDYNITISDEDDRELSRRDSTSSQSSDTIAEPSSLTLPSRLARYNFNASFVGLITQKAKINNLRNWTERAKKLDAAGKVSEAAVITTLMSKYIYSHQKIKLAITSQNRIKELTPEQRGVHQSLKKEFDSRLRFKLTTANKVEVIKQWLDQAHEKSKSHDQFQASERFAIVEEYLQQNPKIERALGQKYPDITLEVTVEESKDDAQTRVMDDSSSRGDVTGSLNSNVDATQSLSDTSSHQSYIAVLSGLNNTNDSWEIFKNQVDAINRSETATEFDRLMREVKTHVDENTLDYTDAQKAFNQACQLNGELTKSLDALALEMDQHPRASGELETNTNITTSYVELVTSQEKVKQQKGNLEAIGSKIIDKQMETLRGGPDYKNISKASIEKIGELFSQGKTKEADAVLNKFTESYNTLQNKLNQYETQMKTNEDNLGIHPHQWQAKIDAMRDELKTAESQLKQLKSDYPNQFAKLSTAPTGNSQTTPPPSL